MKIKPLDIKLSEDVEKHLKHLAYIKSEMNEMLKLSGIPKKYFNINK